MIEDPEFKQLCVALIRMKYFANNLPGFRNCLSTCPLGSWL